MTRSTDAIKADIKVLDIELAASRAIESQNQLMLLMHDELDSCPTVSELREFIKNTLLPAIFPYPKEGGSK